MAIDHRHISRWQGDLVPHIVDRLARERPDAAYGLWPVAPTSYAAGLRTVTYSQLANVVNGLAWWLVEHLGPGKDGEVLTYVGPNDVRLIALVVAAIKTGYVIFLTSPRNSPEAHRALFDRLKCQTLVTTDPTPPPAVPILEAVKPRKLTIPSVDELLSKPYPLYVYDKTFQAGRWDPFIVIHTSGSTGFPKPLIWNQETCARHHNCTGRDVPEGVPSLDQVFLGKRVLSTLPPFHGAGISQYLFYSIPFGSTVIAPAAAAIATAEGVVEALKQTPADVAVLVPSIVAELARNPELLDYCATHLEMILYIGGDLPQAIGDLVAAKVPLRCQWGASEVGIPQQLMPPELGRNDWRYVRFHPSVGAVFDEVTDGIYELVIRRDDAALLDTQTVFSIRGFEQLEKEYRTRDLFERHPTVPDTWCWRARADDIIVFLNGEKTNPVSMEQHIVAKNPELGGALVIGAQRFQAALLIEPVASAATTAAGPLTTAEQAALIERIWPSVEEANRVAPAHARIEKSLILITTADRPLIRAGKGTIQRSASIAQYAAEIDTLYANADTALDADDSGASTPLDLTNADVVALFIRDSVLAVTGWSNLDYDDSVSFFARGMDSLQALRLTRALRRGLYRPDLALPTIYQNPTVSQLTAAVLAQEKNKNGPSDADRDIMEPLLATYRGLIHQIPKPKSLVPGEAGHGPIDVILTGSTGSLGTFLLHALLARPGIGHIFCLNRSSDGGAAVQGARFAAAGLATGGGDLLHDSNRVTFLQADLASPSLGLDEATYETLRTRVALVIHNAWLVNFNLGLPAFRPQLAGLVNLFALSAAAASHHTMRVVFISSVSAVGGRHVAGAGPAPEAVLEPLETPYANGYARSKFLSELLCDAAARHLGVPVAIARVGQVAGSVRRGWGQGIPWNRAEWLPSLVISSLLRLGCVPDSLGANFSDIDWVPSDLLADVVVDLAVAVASQQPGVPGGAGAEVFNLRNPHTTAWHTLLPAITDGATAARARLGYTQALDVVKPSTWLAKLQESMEVKGDDSNGDLATMATSNPAIKLLDFYRSVLWPAREDDAETKSQQQPMMSVEHALLTSPTLREMQPIGLDWMRQWVEGWMSMNEDDEASVHEQPSADRQPGASQELAGKHQAMKTNGIVVSC